MAHSGGSGAHLGSVSHLLSLLGGHALRFLDVVGRVHGGDEEAAKGEEQQEDENALKGGDEHSRQVGFLQTLKATISQRFSCFNGTIYEWESRGRLEAALGAE